jgi:2-(1,2-epoxy-1,2-dihydrophenyl)acetyl-CoA isomerase
MSDPIKATICEDIATLLFNRPKALNAFDLDTITLFAEYLINFSADQTIRGVVISGEGNVFCSGGDLKWVGAWPDGYAAAFHNLAARFHQAVIEIRRMRKPVVAAINGVAAGGGFSLALACDFRVMAKSAVFRQAYTSYGLSIDGGGTFILPKLVGMARALEIAAFDRPISAEQALIWGLATGIVEDGHAVEEATKLAQEIARGPIHSFGYSKQLFTDSFNNSFEAHLERERAALSACAAHVEGEEGIASFVGKRKPVFSR